MGNRVTKKQGIITDDLEVCEERYIKKITMRRRNNALEGNFMPSSDSLKDLLQTIDELIDYIFDKEGSTTPVIYMKQQARQFTSKDLSSIMSFLLWESEFLDVMRDPTNEAFNYDLENKRIAQFMKLENNVISLLIQAFDLGIVCMYQTPIGELLKKTCPKYDNIGYKTKTVQRMITFMQELDTQELQPLEDIEDRRKCIKTLKEIMNLVKKLGVFLSKLLQLLRNQPISSDKKTEIYSTTLTINCLLKYNFCFYIFGMFLSRIFITKEIGIWIIGKKKQLNKNQGFDDLVYLNQFIASEKDQKTLRELTRRNMKDEMSSKDAGSYNYLYAQINQKKMEMNEFLGHVNHHLKLDLDEIFFSNLSDFMFFFNKIEDFMDKVFHNAELEIKIDLIRLILRVNDSTEFFYRIFLINLMDLEFLSSCQIFALFNQVLLCSELKVKTKV